MYVCMWDTLSGTYVTTFSARRGAHGSELRFLSSELRFLSSELRFLSSPGCGWWAQSPYARSEDLLAGKTHPSLSGTLNPGLPLYFRGKQPVLKGLKDPPPPYETPLTPGLPLSLRVNSRWYRRVHSVCPANQPASQPASQGLAAKAPAAAGSAGVSKQPVGSVPLQSCLFTPELRW